MRFSYLNTWLTDMQSQLNVQWIGNNEKSNPSMGQKSAAANQKIWAWQDDSYSPHGSNHQPISTRIGSQIRITDVNSGIHPTLTIAPLTENSILPEKSQMPLRAYGHQYAASADRNEIRDTEGGPDLGMVSRKWVKSSTPGRWGLILDAKAVTVIKGAEK